MRYLTKSKFKKGLECSQKLIYCDNKSYADVSSDNSFLAALADGGNQVGELAKFYFPGGVEVETLDNEEAKKQTDALLSEGNITIYEPAIYFEDMLVRVDVLVKRGANLDLYEVKAKAFPHEKERPFTSKKGLPLADWKPYLYDIAYQKYVTKQAFPNASVRAHLTLIDKTASASKDGLNQKFLIQREGKYASIKVSEKITQADLTPPLLISINVDDICDAIFSSEEHRPGRTETFVDLVNTMRGIYQRTLLSDSQINTACEHCEYKNPYNLPKLLDGRKECFTNQLHWSEKDFEEPTIFDLWNFRGKDKSIAAGIFKLKDLDEDDFSGDGDLKNGDGITPKQRQYLQIEKVKNQDNTPYIDRQGLLKEMQSWQYPLHFIDFETTRVAIPFHASMHPYEGIAFQFSHHTIDEKGNVKHANQYLSTKQNFFPSFEFVRQLKKALGTEGTIFCYSQHENSTLNEIHRQLEASKEPDKTELQAFIETITHSNDKAPYEWHGARDMVDQWAMVKRYFYAPQTNGSNSIKQILPAILELSPRLQDLYSQPIYGADGGIHSFNFKDHIWLQRDTEGKIFDPYKHLPPLIENLDPADIEFLKNFEELNDGGAALIAYGMMQFTELSDIEREALAKGLLKYCELDTLAMVMLHQGWEDLVTI